MRVFVAGATGVIGRRLLPVLTSQGHEVIGLARSYGAAVEVEMLGAVVAEADALDSDALTRVVTDAAPDAVIHLLTAIPAKINPRRMSRDFAQTNRLRTEGTRNLLYAAQQAGAKRIITQGLACIYEPNTWVPATEVTPLWRDPPRQFAPVLAALRTLEQRTRQADGLVLRLGQLYGHGTIYGRHGSFVRQVQAGKIPLIGSGDGTFSFTHVDDAASAIAAALHSHVRGALNIVDDEPAPVREWLPILAELLEAPPPKHIPLALARLTAGAWGVAFMTQLRGADNTLARRTLDWAPHYSSWRQGLAAELTHAAHP
ncbi:nucleoside-diphosphate-sugar epimerase [Kribbella sp. VKM Ac-2569]|uniref:NAD-dependent epimerase/dehydratase family protein n=1 Tax=Kribbella sp. VKM Ac-2569 TaxID=2512220 RepID=UPI00102BAE49|nr:NAD(P)-dependent oxidoreductase [Kribbella sp. VKM Ac-2569]RZT28564.1 nucleoside-diphosphate-sugar epimerase [Kribbella sp. VKM Ac-2569]